MTEPPAPTTAAARPEQPVLTVDSVLESVVVYSSGAVCTRRAHCVLPGGNGQVPIRLRLEGLPVTLYEHSLRGRILSGPAGLRITDIRLDVEAHLQRPEELPALRLDLEDAEDRREEARERRDRLAAEIKEVAAFRAVPPQPKRGDPPRWAPVESILALAGFVDARLAVLQDRLRSAEEDLRRAEHDVAVLRDRVARMSSTVPADRAQACAAAVVTLDRIPGADGEPVAGSGIDIALEYQVPGATWSPVYQLRLNRNRPPGTKAAGTLVLRAAVAQSTGEDWSGVRLGLSTADPLRRTDLPELRSLRIGRRQAEPVFRGWREPPAGLEELFAGYDSAVAERRRRTTAHPGAVPAAAPAVKTKATAGGQDTSPEGSPEEEIDWMDGEAPVAAPTPPVPPPASGAPPMPAPGAPPASAPVSGPVPQVSFGAPPIPAAAPRRLARSRGPSSTPAGLAAQSAAAPGAAPGGTPEPVQIPPHPPEELLDYARLTLAGPDEPGIRGKLRPASSGPSAVVAEYLRRAESVSRLERPLHAVDVRTSAGSFDYRFDTAAPVDIEADAAWHTVPVCEIPVRMESEYVCVPSVDEAVYETVLLTNTSGHALLAGPVDVTVDGDFVLTARLPTLAPGQRRRVGIGVAESVQVARRTHMRESTAGLRGGTTVLDHRIEIDLANRLPHPVVVEVRERIPVTTDRDIRIEERPAQPPWVPREDPDDGTPVRGCRVWRVSLEPGQTATLTGGYEIRIPAHKVLVGGNRRS